MFHDGFQSTHSLRSATALADMDEQGVPVSIHALLAECDRNAPFLSWAGLMFQSTHSLRSATMAAVFPLWGKKVSIHALLAECDYTAPSKLSHKRRFQSTHSLRSATGGTLESKRELFRFQSTHSLRSATITKTSVTLNVEVSIHALLAECDFFIISPVLVFSSFNPRTPCGVRRCKASPKALHFSFQSTHSLRSATKRRNLFHIAMAVSIHALLAECDHIKSSITAVLYPFQSTHSLRSATMPGLGLTSF